MFGNMLGWGISGVIAVMMGLFVWLIDQASVMTPPTAMGTNPAFIEPLAPSFSPGTMVEMDRPCTGHAYQQAIDDYLSSRQTYQQLLRANQPEDLTTFSAIKLILDATHCKGDTVFGDRTESLVNYANEHPQLNALRDLGYALLRHALLHKSSPEVALRYEQAAFSLGAKLFSERITYAELSLGMDLMSQSVVGMKQLAQSAKDVGQVEKLENFSSRLTTFMRQSLLPTWQVVSAIDQRLVERHAGDVFLLARDSHERMWRVEAMLKLGRYRYNAGRASDQRGAARVLKRYAAHSDDPVVRQAAAAALELTSEQYHRLY